MEGMVQLMSGWFSRVFRAGVNGVERTFFDAKVEFERSVGLVADGEGNVLEFAMGVGYVLSRVPV